MLQYRDLKVHEITSKYFMMSEANVLDATFWVKNSFYKIEKMVNQQVTNQAFYNKTFKLHMLCIVFPIVVATVICMNFLKPKHGTISLKSWKCRNICTDDSRV